MKPIKSVKVTGSTGQVEAVTYDRWSKTIEGVVFEFALHADPTPGQPFLRDLRVSEVSTGFDTDTVILHPVHKVQMTEAAFKVLATRQIKQAARAALHRKLNEVGYVNFVQAVVQGQIKLAKLGEPKPVPAAIQSENFDKEKGLGWQLKKNGGLDLRAKSEAFDQLIGKVS